MAWNRSVLLAPRLTYLPRLLYIPVPNHLMDAIAVPATCSLERIRALPDVPHGFDSTHLSENQRSVLDAGHRVAVLYALAVPGFRSELDCQTVRSRAESMDSTSMPARVNGLGRLLTLLGWLPGRTSIGDISHSSPGSQCRIVLSLRNQW